MYSSNKHPSLSPHNQHHQGLIHRNHSPHNKVMPKQSKTYTSDEVNRVIKAYVEPKLHFLKNEIVQKQRLIQELNLQLDQNDQKIKSLANHIEMISRQLSTPRYQSYSSVNMTNHNISQESPQNMLMKMEKGIQETVQRNWQLLAERLESIKIQINSAVKKNWVVFQMQMESQNQTLRNTVHQFIDTCRTKNNNYWLKIKEALNKLNAKIHRTEESNKKTVEDFRIYVENHQSIGSGEIQHSRETVRILVELKRSVGNIYENYKGLLQEQSSFRLNLDGQQNYNSPNNDNRQHVNLQQKYYPNNQTEEEIELNFEDTDIMESEDPPNLETRNHQKNYLKHKKMNESKDPIIEDRGQLVLEYSREEQLQTSKHKKNRQILGDGQQGQLQRTSEEMGYQTFQQPERNKEEFQHKYFVPNMSKPLKIKATVDSPGKKSSNNSSIPRYSNMKSPNQSSLGMSYYLTSGEHQGLSQLGSSKNRSFFNLSLQYRKQMTSSVKERLEELIEVKALKVPLEVHLDEINCLKTKEGHYLFDLKKNMFKITIEDASSLESLGLIKLIK